MEGHFETERQRTFDPVRPSRCPSGRNARQIAIPGLASLYLTHDWNGEVQGIEGFSARELADQHTARVLVVSSHGRHRPADDRARPCRRCSCDGAVACSTRNGCCVGRSRWARRGSSPSPPAGLSPNADGNRLPSTAFCARPTACHRLASRVLQPRWLFLSLRTSSSSAPASGFCFGSSAKPPQPHQPGVVRGPAGAHRRHYACAGTRRQPASYRAC